MAPFGIEWEPPRTQLRHFGWVLALVLAVAGARLAPAPAALALELLAALMFALGTVWPSSLRWPFLAVAVATAPAAWVVSRVLLTVVYYGLLTPLALGLRLLGRDTLRCRLEPQAATYWQPRVRVRERRSYRRPL